MLRHMNRNMAVGGNIPIERLAKIVIHIAHELDVDGSIQDAMLELVRIKDEIMSYKYSGNLQAERCRITGEAGGRGTNCERKNFFRREQCTSLMGNPRAINS